MSDNVNHPGHYAGSGMECIEAIPQEDQKMEWTPFEQFCLAHCCASDCRQRSSYCPIADTVLERNGKITGDASCESVWYQYMRGKKVE